MNTASASCAQALHGQLVDAWVERLAHRLK
jgi:hypothetical protein